MYSKVMELTHMVAECYGLSSAKLELHFPRYGVWMIFKVPLNFHGHGSWFVCKVIALNIAYLSREGEHKIIQIPNNVLWNREYSTEYSRRFPTFSSILSVPQNTVMDLNNLMILKAEQCTLQAMSTVVN